MKEFLCIVEGVDDAQKDCVFDETLAMMLQDGELTEAEAIAILEQEQGELF